MKESETNLNGKGRPSKSEQLQIERRLKDLFMKGTSVYYAVKKTDHSPNTVKKCYKGFYQDVRELEDPEFVQACKDRMILACLGIDDQISKLEEMQEELEIRSQSDKKQAIKLYKPRINIAKSIVDFHIKRLNIANSPTLREMLEALKMAEEQK